MFVEKLPIRHKKTWKIGDQSMQLCKILALSVSKHVQGIYYIIQASVPPYIIRV
jgi:hypothetical protein